MNLSAPKNLTFWLAVIVAIVGVLGQVVPIAAIAGFAFWLVVVAFVILALGNLLDGF